MSLLTLALVFAGAGIRFGIPAYQQGSVIDEIAKYGGLENGDVRPFGPSWLRRWVGSRRMLAFDDIRGLKFRADINKGERMHYFWIGPAGPVIGDAEFPCIRKIPNLERLGLSCTNVSDAGIAHLPPLRKLEILTLDGTAVTDASVPILKQLKNLKELSLRGTRITDAGIAELESALPALTVYKCPTVIALTRLR